MPKHRGKEVERAGGPARRLPPRRGSPPRGPRHEQATNRKSSFDGPAPRVGSRLASGYPVPGPCVTADGMEAREAKATHGSIVVPTRLLGQLGQRAAHAHLEVEKHKTNAAMRRAAQQAEDRRAPPGYRTITVLSENVAGRSLRVKLFGGHEEEWYAREIGCRWLALHGDMRQRLAEEARVIGQLNHQNVVRFEGLVWSEDRNTVFLLSHCMN